MGRLSQCLGYLLSPPPGGEVLKSEKSVTRVRFVLLFAQHCPLKLGANNRGSSLMKGFRQKPCRDVARRIGNEPELFRALAADRAQSYRSSKRQQPNKIVELKRD